MENMIRPNKKLYTKQWLMLATITLIVLLAALILYALIPLDDDVTHEELGRYLWPITGGALVLMWIAAVPILILWIKNLAYEIGEERITIHKGILTKVKKNIPYRAITDFILHRSLYDRFLGIASIRIQTAGQTQTPTGYEGNMAGLIDWDNLHQELRQRVKSLHPVSGALASTESPPAAVPADSNLLQQILEELKAIRKALERKQD
jgi:putative membrane protein